MMTPQWPGTEPLMGDRAYLTHGAITPDRRAAQEAVRSAPVALWTHRLRSVLLRINRQNFKVIGLPESASESARRCRVLGREWGVS